MYQTLPARSCAYQSNVRSSGFPPAHTLSSTTVASMPMIRFLWRVTRTTFSSRVFPSSPTPLLVNTVPGFSGRYGLSIGPPKSAGSIVRVVGLRHRSRVVRGDREEDCREKDDGCGSLQHGARRYPRRMRAR